MAQEVELNEEISRVVIFVQMTNGAVRQVITTPGLKLMALRFIEENSPSKALKVGGKENVEFEDLKNKEIES